jgi:site-specific DNA-methyltransferase (adenine-specific)
MELQKDVNAAPVHGIVRLPDTAPLAAYEKDGITIYRGESLNVLRQLPDAICDCVITDPPYSSGGLFRGDRSGDAAQKYVGWNNSDKKQYGTFGGDSRDQRSFFAWASLWLAESWRIAKPGAQCYVFTDWRQLPVVTDAVQAGGWTWRGLLVWDKGVGRPMKGRYRNHLEYVVWCSNGAMPEADDIYPSTLLHVPTVPSDKRDHPTQKPVALIETLLSVCPQGGIVLDPFMGSGTTLEAAKYSGRGAIGIEIDPKYCDDGARRLSQGILF